MSLSEAYPPQYYCNLRARRPRSGCRSPGKLSCASFLEIEYLGRWRQVSLSRIGSLDKSRHVDLIGPLDWWIPEQAEA